MLHLYEGRSELSAHCLEKTWEAETISFFGTSTRFESQDLGGIWHHTKPCLSNVTVVCCSQKKDYPPSINCTSGHGRL